MITSDTTLYAGWRLLYIFTVAFNSNDGSYVENQTVTEGNLITKPTDPVRDDNTFINWYTNIELTTLWDFTEDILVSNMTMYAKWEDTSSINAITGIYKGVIADETNSGSVQVQIKSTNATLYLDLEDEVMAQDIDLISEEDGSIIINETILYNDKTVDLDIEIESDGSVLSSNIEIDDIEIESTLLKETDTVTILTYIGTFTGNVSGLPEGFYIHPGGNWNIIVKNNIIKGVFSGSEDSNMPSYTENPINGSIVGTVENNVITTTMEGSEVDSGTGTVSGNTVSGTWSKNTGVYPVSGTWSGEQTSAIEEEVDQEFGVVFWTSTRYMAASHVTITIDGESESLTARKSNAPTEFKPYHTLYSEVHIILDEGTFQYTARIPGNPTFNWPVVEWEDSVTVTQGDQIFIELKDDDATFTYYE